MKFKSVLNNLDKELGSKLEVRRYTLPGMISESYRTLYNCESGSNMHKLVESHLEDVKKNPAEIERLSRQLAIIKEVQKLTESGELNDKDLEAATNCEYEGDVEKKVAEDREERLAPTEEIKESTEEVEDEDLLEDTELTDEEVEELTKHLAEIRKAKKVTESEETPEEEDLDEVKLYEPTKEEAATIVSRIQRKYGNEISEQDYMDLLTAVLGEDDVATDIIDQAVEAAGIKILGESVDEDRDFEWTDDLWAVVKADGTYAGIPCRSYEEARQLSYHEGSKIFKLVLDSEVDETKTYESLNLSEFRRKSAGKAFIKTFKKLDKQLHEGTALTRQEAISLYKAANSAMTHLSVELEHNPEFLSTFNESVTLLSEDVSKLLESMKNDKAPSKATMKSLAKFSEALLKEAEEEEELPPIEDEEDTAATDEIPAEEEVSEFDQEYAEARVELHKDLADEHADEEDPEVEEKLAQDAEEIAALPGVTEEQVAEIIGEEPVEETPEEVEEEPAEEVEDTDESAPVEEETPDLELGDDEEITDDELAELKKHLREFRESKSQMTESKGRKLARRAK